MRLHLRTFVKDLVLVRSMKPLDIQEVTHTLPGLCSRGQEGRGSHYALSMKISKVQQIFFLIPVASRSKACGRSLGGIAGLNLAGCIGVCPL